MNEIIINEKKSKLALMTIAAIGMTLLSIFNLLLGIPDFNLIYISIGVIGLTFFGACLLLAIKRFSNTKPLLVINEKGITGAPNSCIFQFISWSEIESIDVTKSMNQKFIVFNVVDLDVLMKRISPWNRFVMKFNMKLKYPPVTMSLNTADKRFDEVLLIIQNALEDYKKNKEIVF